MAKILKVTITDENGFVLDTGEVEVTEPTSTVCVRLFPFGKIDPLSDLDLSIGLVEPDPNGG